MTNVFKNKWVLYFFLLLSLGSLLDFAWKGDVLIVAVYIMIAFLASFFTKNMTVILFLALLFTNVLKCGTSLCLKHEGFEGEIQVEQTPKVAATDGEEEVEQPSTSKKPSQGEVKGFVSEMKEDMSNLLVIQEKMIKNMEDMDPLLTKAQTIIDKFEGKYGKTQKNDFMTKMKKAMEEDS